ncbi:MAG: CpcT/CpeT family chromophore lyase, partial [Halieaceae bacterium]
MIRVFVLLCAVMATSAHADQAAILSKDFRVMMEWLPGVYDNQEQVYFEAEQNIDQALRHERVHTVFAPVELPAFGDHVFYVQQHLNDDPSQIYRQRIYSFRADDEINAIRLTVHI